MYILYAGGFTSREQEIISSWSKNQPQELGEGFSVGNSLQVGRIVEIDEDYFKILGYNNLKEMIYHIRETREQSEEYLEKLKEIRFFYNDKIRCIFSVEVNDTGNDLCITVTKVPFHLFFTMVDKDFLTAFLGIEEEGEPVPDEEIELVETGFLSRYLICSSITDTRVFLFEAVDFLEFRKIFLFIKKLGEILNWNWKQRKDLEHRTEDEID